MIDMSEAKDKERIFKAGKRNNLFCTRKTP